MYAVSNRVANDSAGTSKPQAETRRCHMQSHIATHPGTERPPPTHRHTETRTRARLPTALTAALLRTATLTLEEYGDLMLEASQICAPWQAKMLVSACMAIRSQKLQFDPDHVHGTWNSARTSPLGLQTPAHLMKCRSWVCSHICIKGFPYTLQQGC